MPGFTIEKSSAGGYVLRAESVVPCPLDEVFAFFADATNLERLTPKWLRFQVLTPAPIALGPGALIDYRLRIHGVPLRWQTEIVAWDPPHRFVDDQRRGPYRAWRHEHRFESCEGGTRVTDEVRYSVPGGALIHALFVGRDVKNIFRYRQQQLAEIFA